ncbi:putative glycoside hydrolase [Natronospora cellulosivora (SeqCode)]
MKKNIYFIIVLMLFSFSVDSVEASLELSYDLGNAFQMREFNLEKDTLFIPEFHVRGIYVTGWVAGTSRMDNLIHLVDNSILNTMVIDIKDEHGDLSYISNIPLANEIGADRRKVKDITALLSILNDKGIYTIARLVLFRDTLLATNRPDLALNMYNTETNEIIRSTSWVNPFRRAVWDYNIQVAKDAINMGFDEIQFDYIRYPAQGDRVLQSLLPHGRSKSSVINDFSNYALNELSDYDVPISIDVFGMTTTVNNDLGIGQNFNDLAEKFRIISPMIYPSHYGPGVYGIENPDLEPYNLINRSLRDALRKIESIEDNDDIIIRPWLQDFSLNNRYTYKEVLEQIRAAENLGIKEWLLWNPSSNYQEAALKPPY